MERDWSLWKPHPGAMTKSKRDLRFFFQMHKWKTQLIPCLAEGRNAKIISLCSLVDHAAEKLERQLPSASVRVCQQWQSSVALGVPQTCSQQHSSPPDTDSCSVRASVRVQSRCERACFSLGTKDQAGIKHGSGVQALRGQTCVRQTQAPFSFLPRIQ